MGMKAVATLKKKGTNKYQVIFLTRENLDGMDEIRDWCSEMYGPGGRNGKCRWRYGWTSDTDTFHFKHGEDATMFMLRWG
jgi:hypothetical protein